MKPRPIALSLSLLVLGSSAAAWLASLALVFALPRATEAGPTVRDVVAAFRQPGTAGNRYLSARRKAEVSSDRSETGIDGAVARRIAGALGGQAELRVSINAFLLPHSSSEAPSIDAAIRNGTLMMPRATFALRQSDGSWSVLTARQPVFSTWHLQVAGGYLVFGLLMVPIALLVGRRLSAPLRAMAGWAQESSFGRDCGEHRIEGSLELQQVAAALWEMRERLQRQVEERTTMLAAVAHDLRTPLTALRVRTEAAPFPARERMVMDIERMERMIVQFLHYVSGARDVGEQRDVDLASVIRAAASEAGDGAEVRISTPLPPLRVRGDPLDLQRMVHNLLDNALRHGGGAEVSVHEAGGQALVTVADEGPGMPSEELERVFRPFYRPDYARNSATGGTGLGLAIARAIARAHGGDVTLRNRSPNGLEAEVRLTVLRESAPAEEATAA